MQSGKPQFGYIYGLALMGSASVYVLLNLMSPAGIDAHRVASVLGYCLLPMVCVSAVSVTFSLECVLRLRVSPRAHPARTVARGATSSPRSPSRGARTPRAASSSPSCA